MTTQEFKDWQEQMKSQRNRKITQQEFADMLGVSRRTIVAIRERGMDRHSKVFRLACKALLHNLDIG